MQLADQSMCQVVDQNGTPLFGNNFSPNNGDVPAKELARPGTRNLKVGPAELTVKIEAVADSTPPRKYSFRVPADQQMVLIVRFYYEPWEDMNGMPSQVLMRGDRKAALSGDVQVAMDGGAMVSAVSVERPVMTTLAFCPSASTIGTEPM